MGSGFERVLVIGGYYLAAYALCCLISALVISSLTRFLIKIERGRADGGHPVSFFNGVSFFNNARLVGALEQIMYITAILLGKPEFIAVWLVVKVVDAYKQSPARYSIFLVGTSLSLIFAVATALLMQQLLPPFPSLSPWRLSAP